MVPLRRFRQPDSVAAKEAIELAIFATNSGFRRRAGGNGARGTVIIRRAAMAAAANALRLPLASEKGCYDPFNSCSIESVEKLLSGRVRGASVRTVLRGSATPCPGSRRCAWK